MREDISGQRRHSKTCRNAGCRKAWQRFMARQGGEARVSDFSEAYTRLLSEARELVASATLNANGEAVVNIGSLNRLKRQTTGTSQPRTLSFRSPS